MIFNIVLKYPFRINSTHTFMAGGYAGIYALCDSLRNAEMPKNDKSGDGNKRPSICDDPSISPDSSQLFGGGVILDRAWIFDGFAWNELPPMSTTRDRPHCSLVEDENGLVWKNP